jgi:hypothetical protein
MRGRVRWAALDALTPLLSPLPLCAPACLLSMLRSAWCSAMVQAAIQTAQESKLGGERYGNRGSAGQYLTRSVPSQSGAN